jgi:site-specific DNA-methyltransferase (adenine-specific)
MGEQTKLIDERDGVIGIFNIGSISEPKVNTLEYPEKERIKLFITDPPYNVGFKYGPGVNDSLSEDDYATLLKNTFKRCYETADDDAHLFIIHYPDVLAKHWDILNEDWDFHQWITWVYPSNIGHSTKRWTTAHRAILWLKKGNPYFNAKAVTQEFKNPNVSVVQEKKKQGINGVALYDWWNINLCKNVSSDYKGYENQIPNELLRRIILCASRPGEWVGDPFAGTFSTPRAALELGRRGWGCDINSYVEKFWPTISEWIPRNSDPNYEPNIDASRYDQILELIPQKQLDNALFKLLKQSTLKQLTKAIGRVNGPKIHELLNHED